MTFPLKFMHLRKHNHFPRLPVSKFLVSNPNNLSLESEVKCLSRQTMYTSNQFSTVVLSGNTVKQWVLAATPSILFVGFWGVGCFVFFFFNSFFPVFRVPLNWSSIAAVLK